MREYKYTVTEVKANLAKLEKKLIDKDRKEIIWVIADRKDFKPLVVEKVKNGVVTKKTIKYLKDIRKYLLNDERKKYFIGKKFAAIQFFFDNDILKEVNEKNYKNYLNDVIFQIHIAVMQVDKKGKIADETDRMYYSELKVVFKLEDLLNRKVKYRDSEKLMRIVYDRKIISSNLIGIYYPNLVKKIKERKIKTDFI